MLRGNGFPVILKSMLTVTALKQPFLLKYRSFHSLPSFSLIFHCRRSVASEANLKKMGLIRLALAGWLSSTHQSFNDGFILSPGKIYFKIFKELL